MKRCLAVLLALWVFFPAVAVALADLDGDGRLDARDVFCFSTCWMTDSATADLTLDGIVDDQDLLLLLQDFRLREIVPTPTPTAALPAPIWIHPALEDMWKVFYVEYGQEDDFLDWSDVPGAAAYEVVADITLEFSTTPLHKTWLVDVTATPGIPASNSKVDHYWYSTDLVVVRVRALTDAPTPEPGEFSDERAFYLSLQFPPTPTPTPSIKPTADIDFSGDEITNKLDILYLQKSWLTGLGQHQHYDPAVAVLAAPTTEVDARDVLAFIEEYERQRVPLAVPRLVSPASGEAVTADVFLHQGLTYDWDPVPDTLGGVKYTLTFMGPFDSDEYPVTFINNIEETERTQIFVHMPKLGKPRSEYRWTVEALSVYGIKISSASAPPNVLYVEQSW